MLGLSRWTSTRHNTAVLARRNGTRATMVTIVTTRHVVMTSGSSQRPGPRQNGITSSHSAFIVPAGRGVGSWAGSVQCPTGGESQDMEGPSRRGRGSHHLWMTESAMGGLEIPEFFRNWPTHVAKSIYEGTERKALDFQWRKGALAVWHVAPSGLENYAAIQAGLGLMTFIFYEDVDERLVSAFIERWNPETNSFHMPFGEMTITLANVYFLLGIKIQGESMGVSVEEIHLQVRERHSKKLTEANATLGYSWRSLGATGPS